MSRIWLATVVLVAIIAAPQTAAGELSARDIFAQFEDPLPEGCLPNPDDLTLPEVPEGFDRMVRFVEIDRSYRASLSIGSLEEFLLSPNQIEPSPQGHDWGTCTARIRFAPVSDAPTDDTDAGGTQADGETNVANTASTGSPATKAGNHAGRPPTSQPDMNCEAPLSASPRKVLVPDVRFLSRACTDFSTSAAADSAVGEHTDYACGAWGDEGEHPGPSQYATVGLVLPGGDEIRWGLSVGLGADYVLADRGPDTGDAYMGPNLDEMTFPNGVVIDEDVEHGYTALIPVGMLPYWAGSSIPGSTSEPIGPELVAEVAIDGQAANDLLFVRDHVFDMGLNRLSDTLDGFQLRLGASAANPNGQPMEPNPCLGRVEFDVTINSPLPIFTTSGSLNMTLNVGESADINAELIPFTQPEKIKDQHRDLLVGAELIVRAFEIKQDGSRGEPLRDMSVGIYRFVDASDDQHQDATIAMARTLADGEGKAVRQREIEMHVTDRLALRFQPTSTDEFAFKTHNGSTALEFPFVQFDPEFSTSRSVVDSELILTRASSSREVGRIALKGRAEPKNRILFNESALLAKLEWISDLAKIDEYTQIYEDLIFYPDWHDKRGQVDYPTMRTEGLYNLALDRVLVHPALVTADERTHLDSAQKRQSLATDIKKRMEELWGSDANGLLQALTWADAQDGNNGVDIQWLVRENWNAGAPFAMGITPEPIGTDNREEILSTFRPDIVWNDAEAAYRLSELMNKQLVGVVRVWPDSLLEQHVGSVQGPSMTRSQLLTAVAKTAVHEIGHTFSLSHPAQSSTGGKPEIQILQFPSTPPTDPIHIEFAGRVTSVTAADYSAGGGIDTDTIADRLASLPTIGYETYANPPSGRRGVKVQWCVRPTVRCPGVPSANRMTAFLVTFQHHLHAYDLPLINMSHGETHSVADGEGFVWVAMNALDGTCRRGTVESYIENWPNPPKRKDILHDIMHGGYPDTQGLLAFQDKVSKAQMQMALGLSYTRDEAKHAVQLSHALANGYLLFGGEDFKVVNWDEEGNPCAGARRLDPTTATEYDDPWSTP